MAAHLTKGVRGVRLDPAHDARTRAKIKTSQIVNRLQAFALGENDPRTGEPVEMTKSQIAAAVTLLDRTLPRLAQTTLNVNDNREIEDFSKEQLLELVRNPETGSFGAAEEEGSGREPDSVH